MGELLWKTAKSVANMINYGNEPDALQLLRPPRSVERGVHEEHYIQLRPRGEIQVGGTDTVHDEQA